jgi:hypothetical protein
MGGEPSEKDEERRQRDPSFGGTDVDQSGPGCRSSGEVGDSRRQLPHGALAGTFSRKVT